MKKIKKIVDERQQLEILKVEHYGFWIVFWLLFLSIIVQTAMGVPLQSFGVEFVIFIVACICMTISGLRKGVWDSYTKPGMKSYLLYSLVAAIFTPLLFGIVQYNTSTYFKGNIVILLISAGVMSVFIFVLCFLALFLSGRYITKKRKRLAKEYDEEEN